MSLTDGVASFPILINQRPVFKNTLNIAFPNLFFDSYPSFLLCEGFCSGKASVTVCGWVPICLHVLILISSGVSCLPVETCN